MHELGIFPAPEPGPESKQLMKPAKLSQQAGAQENCRTSSAGERLLKRRAKRVGTLVGGGGRTVAREQKLKLRIPEMPRDARQTTFRVPGVVVREADDRGAIEWLATQDVS